MRDEFDQPFREDGTPSGGAAQDRGVVARGRVVFLAHSSFLSPFRVGSHQLARAFARRGWEVLHVPLPVTLAHLVGVGGSREYRQRLSRAWWGPAVIEPGITEIMPFVWLPWPLARRLGSQAGRWYACGPDRLRQRAATLGFSRPDLLLIDEPRMIGIARKFNPRLMLYRATDLYHHLKSDSTLVDAEREALAKSAGFVATSGPVWNHLSQLAPKSRGLLLPNGVEFEHFRQPRPEPSDLQAIPGPRLVYAGAFDARFDWAAVNRIARQRPHLQLILIGPLLGAQKPAGQQQLPPNVHLLGPRSYDDLPAYLQHANVGLLPMTAHPANAGRSPMKLYEYGAAGLPVLATATPELIRLRLSFVRLYDSLDNVLTVLDGALASSGELGVRAVLAARAMAWSGRVDELLAFRQRLQFGPPGSSAAPLHSRPSAVIPEVPV